MNKSNSIFAAVAFAMAALIAPIRLACLVGYRSRRVVVTFNSERPPVPDTKIVAINALGPANESAVVESDGDRRTAKFFVPFGEFGPNSGLDNRDKKIKPTMQRFDLEAANTMVDSLNSLRGTLARKFRMIPVYEGHPDVRGLENVYQDRGAKGWITAANIGKHDGRDGMFFDAEMTPRGIAMIRDEEFVFGSPRWAMEPMTAANDATQIARPSRLLSFGLTNTPFIPDSIVMANVDFAPGVLDVATVAQMLGMTADAGYADVVAKIAQLMEIVTKMGKGARLVEEAEWAARDAAVAQLAQANTDLAAARAAAANEKDVAQTAGAQLAQAKQDIEAVNTAHGAELSNIKARITDLETQITASNTATAGRDAEISSLKSQLADAEGRISAANSTLLFERNAHAGLVVDGAIAEGRLLPAHRAVKIAEIVAANCDAAAIEAVRSAPALIKTHSVTGGLGGRKPGAETQASLIEAANTEHTRHGGNWTEIYLRLKRARNA